MSEAVRVFVEQESDFRLFGLGGMEELRLLLKRDRSQAVGRGDAPQRGPALGSRRRQVDRHLTLRSWLGLCTPSSNSWLCHVRFENYGQATQMLSTSVSFSVKGRVITEATLLQFCED